MPPSGGVSYWIRMFAANGYKFKIGADRSAKCIIQKNFATGLNIETRRFAIPEILCERKGNCFGVIYEKASHCLAMPPESLQIGGKSEEKTQKLLAKFMTMEQKYPEQCRWARRESWDKLVSFFKEW